MKTSMLRGGVSTITVLAAVLLLIGLCLAPFGETPWEGIRTLFLGALGSPQRLSETLVKTSPLLLTGLAVALAFRTGALNIGAEGQFLVGALGAVAVGQHLGGQPGWIALPVSLLAAFLAAGVWGGIAGVMKSWREVPEVISTIMLNFVALHWVSALVRGGLKDPQAGLPESAEIAVSAHLPRILSGYRIHWGLGLGILLCLAVGFLLSRTTLGFKMRAVGFSPVASLYAGFSPKRTWAASLALSGALAGLGGGVEVCGITYRVYDHLSPGYGYTAIAVALLARLNPIAVIPTAFFFGALDQGAGTLQRELDVPLVLVSVVQGLVILLALLLGFHRPGESTSAPSEEIV